MGISIDREATFPVVIFHPGLAVFPWVSCHAFSRGSVTFRAIPPGSPGTLYPVTMQVEDKDGNVYTLADGAGNQIITNIVEEGGVELPSPIFLFHRWRFALQAPTSKELAIGGSLLA